MAHGIASRRKLQSAWLLVAPIIAVAGTVQSQTLSPPGAALANMARASAVRKWTETAETLLKADAARGVTYCRQIMDKNPLSPATVVLARLLEAARPQIEKDKPLVESTSNWMRDFLRKHPGSPARFAIRFAVEDNLRRPFARLRADVRGEWQDSFRMAVLDLRPSQFSVYRIPVASVRKELLTLPLAGMLDDANWLETKYFNRGGNSNDFFDGQRTSKRLMRDSETLEPDWSLLADRSNWKQLLVDRRESIEKINANPDFDGTIKLRLQSDRADVGLYAVEEEFAGCRFVTGIRRSTLSVLVYPVPGEWLVFAADDITQHPVVGVAIDLFDHAGSLHAETNGDGWCRLPARGRGVLMATRGESLSLVATPEPAPPPKPLPIVWITTDRPMYRPGQTVSFKAVRRDRVGPKLFLPAESELEIRIRDPKQNVLQRRKYRWNDFGSATGSFTLPDEPAIGEYAVEVNVPWSYPLRPTPPTPESDEFRGATGEGARLHWQGHFLVAAYRKADFSLEIKAVDRPSADPDEYAVIVEAKSYTGEPLANTPLQWQLRSGLSQYNHEFETSLAADPMGRRLFDAWLKLDPTDEFEEDNIPENAWPRLTTTGKNGTVTTDAYGRAPIALQFAKEDDRYGFVLQVVANGSGSTPVTSFHEFSNWGEGKPPVVEFYSRWYRPGERCTASIHLNDRFGRPLKRASLKASLDSNDSNGVDNPGRKLKWKKLTTDDNGVAFLQAVVPAQEFSVKIKVGASVYKESFPAPLGGQFTGAADRMYCQAGSAFRVQTSKKPGWLLVAADNAVPNLILRHEFDGPITLPMQAEWMPAVRLADIEIVKNENRVTERDRVNFSVKHSAVLSPPQLDPFQVSCSIEFENAASRRVHETPFGKLNSSAKQPERNRVLVVESRSTNFPGPLELEVAIVDDAIFALTPDQTPSPTAVFFQPYLPTFDLPNGVGSEAIFTNLRNSRSFFDGDRNDGANPITQFSDVFFDPWSNRKMRGQGGGLGGGGGGIGGGGLGGGGSERGGRQPNEAAANAVIRQRFADSMIYLGQHRTGANSKAWISLPEVDDFTRWRAIVRAISKDGRFGIGSTTFVTRRDIMLRLAHSRFYTRGDEAVIRATVRNDSPRDASFTVGLKASGAAEFGNHKSVSVDSGGEAIVSWPIAIARTGSLSLEAFAKSDAGSDAMKVTVPVYSEFVEQSVYRSSVVERDWKTTIELPKDADAQTVRLQLNVASGPQAAIRDALSMLAQYPYGCVEQTLSRFVPAVVARHSMKRLGIAEPKLDDELSKMIASGLGRLYAFQHDDGGWGWWTHDKSDNHMTAYVLLGLAAAHAAGVEVEPKAISGGDAFLSDRRVTIETLYARKRAGADVARVLSEITAPTEATTPDDIANIALLVLAGRRELAPLLKPPGHVPSRPAEIEANALALRAISSVDPKDVRIAKLTQWLLESRRGVGWFSTLDTAQAVMALAETTKPDQPFEAEVRVNNRPVSLNRDGAVTLDSTWLKAGANALVVQQKSGPPLFAVAHLLYHGPQLTEPVKTNAAKARLTIERYTVSSPNKSGWEAVAPGGSVHIGDELKVAVEFDFPTAVERGLIEGPFAAGCEPLDAVRLAKAESDDWEFVHQEIRDDRAAAAFEQKTIGRFEYRLRAVLPGRYALRPARVFGMYDPRQTVSAPAAVIRIVDEKGSK